MQADALIIMAVITELDTGPVRITEVVRTGAVMRVMAALVITWAAPITSGGQDTGDWSTAGESGYTATTL